MPTTLQDLEIISALMFMRHTVVPAPQPKPILKHHKPSASALVLPSPHPTQARQKRLDALTRYRLKKNRRRTAPPPQPIRYHIRKQIANSRPRLRGRFSKRLVDHDAHVVNATSTVR